MSQTNGSRYVKALINDSTGISENNADKTDKMKKIKYHFSGLPILYFILVDDNISNEIIKNAIFITLVGGIFSSPSGATSPTTKGNTAIQIAKLSVNLKEDKEIKKNPIEIIITYIKVGLKNIFIYYQKNDRGSFYS